MAALIRRLARAVAVAAVAGAAPLLCAQTVTTLAGSGSAGFADGSGAAASFDTPLGLTIGPDGNLYVADALNFYIRKVSPAGDVTTFFGDGTWGYEDQHTFPTSLAFDRSGFLYVADQGDGLDGGLIKRIAPDRTVATLVRSDLAEPVAVAVDRGGSVYVLDRRSGLVRISGAFNGFTQLFGNLELSGLAVTPGGDFYLADGRSNAILGFREPHSARAFAGSGKSALEDGSARSAAFRHPAGVAVDDAGNVYVADRDNHVIRRIAPDGLVTTVAGSGARGRADGVGRGATFDSPEAVALDGAGNLYVADTGNHLIRRIALDGGASGERRWIVPSVARVRGARGSFWSSDLTLHDGGTTAVTARLRFLASGADPAAAPQASVALAPDQAVTVPDVLFSAFGIAEGFGALEITAATDRLAVRSRTFTHGAFGTVGDGIPGVASDELYSGSASPLLTGLREDDAYRSNLVLVNGAPVPITLVVRARDDSGSPLGERTYSLPPFGMLQDSGFLRRPELGGAPRANAVVAVSSQTAGAAFTVLATVIDNLSNDPTTVLPAKEP